MRDLKDPALTAELCLLCALACRSQTSQSINADLTFCKKSTPHNGEPTRYHQHRRKTRDYLCLNPVRSNIWDLGGIKSAMRLLVTDVSELYPFFPFLLRGHDVYVRLNYSTGFQGEKKKEKRKTLRLYDTGRVREESLPETRGQGYYHGPTVCFNRLTGFRLLKGGAKRPPYGQKAPIVFAVTS